MATTYAIAAYPREISLRDNSRVTIRPLERDDVDALRDFFLGIPDDERYFLKDDVTSRTTIQQWIEHLNYDRALPLVAVAAGRIVGEAVLVRRRGNARSHVCDLRVTVAPAWRDKGLGTALIRELCDIANDAELDKALFEVVDDCQASAAEAAKALGFVTAGRSKAVPATSMDSCMTSRSWPCPSASITNGRSTNSCKGDDDDQANHGPTGRITFGGVSVATGEHAASAFEAELLLATATLTGDHYESGDNLGFLNEAGRLAADQYLAATEQELSGEGFHVSTTMCSRPAAHRHLLAV